MGSRMVTVVMVAFAAVSACGGVEESSEAGAPHVVPPSFTVGLEPATTAENVIPQIVAAGHGQLAALCKAARPGASVRILNPLASGAYNDMPCTSVLGGEGATGEASAALGSDKSDESIGEAREKLTPFSLACWAATAAIAAAGNFSCADHPREAGCPWGVWGGTTAFSVLCLMF